ncbi:hypothetical protein HPB52_001481 [Rhipicephalus sanguineus]|uniref:Pseudouridylate synthase RPUSD4, mitochondrial n=1 Tax=Rhipicephalus sanguineus TaxID=34632 RepID=A0A9D4SNK9_RHISA|nr:hypothetical protein HPB52_001481 [Rhipicephalus sanguineus]
MAARIVRTSVCSCVRLQATLAGSASSRCIATSRALSDFYGISGDDGVVTVDNPLGDRHERLRRFSHLTRSRDAKVSDETVVAADFGTIRYDRDNKARYHGQFEDDTPLDDFILDTYGGKGSKPGRKAVGHPDESSDQSERQDARDRSVSVRKGARKEKRSRVSADGATPVPTDVQDAAAKSSQEVARTLASRSLPVYDRQLSKGRPSAPVVEMSSFETKGAVSGTDSLRAARSSEQNNVLGSDRLQSIGRFSPAEATVERRRKSAEHVKEWEGKEPSKNDSSSVPDQGNPTAFEYIRKPQQFGLKLDSKGFFILKSEVRPNLAIMLRSEVIDMLRQRVLYDGNDVLILDKPYGMICHGSAKGVPDSHVLVRLLPDLSSALYPREEVKLYTVHRLDRDVTGAIVLAKTQRTADALQTLFEEHKISKTYHAITFGVPDNDLGSAKRMVICPKLEPEFERLVPRFSKTYEAVTHYRVLSSHGRAAYLELKPVTGVKHQIRVHLGFGLRCPILGDHKYSHLRELAPQRLSGDLLTRLNVRQTKVRHIPMHLHASSVLIPEILDGRNLLVTAQLPYHFLQNLKRLKLQRH